MHPWLFMQRAFLEQATALAGGGVQQWSLAIAAWQQAAMSPWMAMTSAPAQDRAPRQPSLPWLGAFDSWSMPFASPPSLPFMSPFMGLPMMTNPGLDFAMRSFARLMAPPTTNAPQPDLGKPIEVSVSVRGAGGHAVSFGMSFPSPGPALTWH